jgi:predicted nucleotide-binding protein
MLGCNYGIAVFEDIDERDFNPNIVLELGFMLALNKRCLILKEKTLPKMPADIVGKLYKEFDFFNIESSISDQIKRWANDIGLDLAL